MSASPAFAGDNFALAPSAHDNLVVFGPKGERVAELSIPSISQSVTVGSTTFQISYGRDANNYITAIIAPSASQPQDLHFTVLNKTVDADKQAVVTLTFPDPKRVIIDPGYIGAVTVNSHTLHHRDLADSSAPAPEPTPAVTRTQVTQTTASVQPQEIPASGVHETSSPKPAPVFHPAPMSAPVAKQTPAADNQPAPAAISKTTAALPGSSEPPASDDSPVPIAPPPLMGSLLSQPPMAAPRGVAGSPQAPGKKMYWAEPITPPSGSAPSVGLDEMKLVAVHGPVQVTTPSGNVKAGTDGMIVPSGSSISTGNSGSAAVFMGGVDSARFLPNTDAKVSQKLAGSTRKTDINLRVGTVFSRVGHRAGEKQDFVVRTPEGVAAARGTSYAVCVTMANGREVTITATQDGIVTLTDATDNHQITITPQNPNQVSLGSVPSLPPSVLSNVFSAFMAELQQFNTNMQAIASNPNPTPAESAYYNANVGFDASTQFYDANNGSFEVLFADASSILLLDSNNNIDTVIPAARRAQNQMLEPFGTVPLTPF